MKVVQEVPLKVTPLVQNLLNQSDTVKSFVPDFFSREACLAAAKTRSFDNDKRVVLSNRLHAQYEGFSLNEKVFQNIEKLKSKTTFTVVTGHQICAAGGPLYLIYKLFSVIRIAQELNESQSEFHFVPVYWMATEDHDIEEIRHFYWGEEKIEFEKDFEGIAGELSTESFLFWLKERKDELRWNEIGLSDRFIRAYSEKNFAEATRSWVNELLGEYGLICIDGNDADLKVLAANLFEKEIEENFIFHEVSKTNAELESMSFTPNIQPRKSNLFWLNKDSGNTRRKRLDENNGNYQTSDGLSDFSKSELKSITRDLSPNVLLRPLYQESILPNIAYIGGPSELGYWMQLKRSFDAANIQMPLLAHRISMTLLRKRDLEFIQKNNFKLDELLRSSYQEAQKKMIQSLNPRSFESEVVQTKNAFNELRSFISEIDPTLIPWLNAEEKRQTDQWGNIEQKMKRALKSKEEVRFNQLEKFFSHIQPKQIAQERIHSLLYATEIVGWEELKEILEKLNPFNYSNTVVG